MLKMIWNTALIVIGIASIAIGIAGVIIPFFPGMPFLLLAIASLQAGLPLVYRTQSVCE